MNKIWMMCSALLFGSSLMAKDSGYLGADRADIEAGLRVYTEKQLSDLKRKDREQLAEPATEEIPQEGAQGPQAQNWDTEIAKLLKADTKKEVSPEHYATPLPNFLGSGNVTLDPDASQFMPMPPRPPKNEWKQAGMPEFGKKEKKLLPSQVVTIPAGSYIMADLLTGVDAPTQTSIPALIRTRMGFVAPNDGFVDLSGCHAIAQATGDLSTERVKLKTVTLSCLSPEGIPSEHNFVAFAAGEDDSFGVPGELRSRQGRVAMMAFLNGVIEGVTKIAAETSSSMVSPTATLGAEGSSSASVEVIRWYLEHAKGLIPTVEVKAGAPVRLVLLETLSIPKTFFKKYSPTKELENAKDDLVY